MKLKIYASSLENGKVFRRDCFNSRLNLALKQPLERLLEQLHKQLSNRSTDLYATTDWTDNKEIIRSR